MTGLVPHYKTSCTSLNILNNDHSIWVDILNVKYGKVNFWQGAIPAKCSWFFRGLCHSAKYIKPFCKINAVNPERTSFLWDPWIFDIPVAFKPTYINMDVDLPNVAMSDLVSDNLWDLNSLSLIFGELPNTFNSEFVSVVPDLDNHWIWLPKPSSCKISSAVYHHLNNQSSFSDPWVGWKHLWKIPVAPRIKHFIWLCIKGRLSTFAFLNQLNIGPDRPCIFCGLHRETINHLFNDCSSAQFVWNQIMIKTNCTFKLFGRFPSWAIGS
ncbi:uncharacterized protein LOC120254484 [Dioscorea cayenensis subsp. rotundata]|uniref:Uncharacterized protein LOC120254484 n=1 Tax=Dioscorea cayennensis subsp. rotundata TaxID=55577 RepID=A0AB40AUH7_DIOCR|nr:uncharacterized protein LOC120254484 [Dioscorea cayenensis subsp. rotundata]